MARPPQNAVAAFARRLLAQAVALIAPGLTAPSGQDLDLSGTHVVLTMGTDCYVKVMMDGDELFAVDSSGAGRAQARAGGNVDFTGSGAGLTGIPHASIVGLGSAALSASSAFASAVHSHAIADVTGLQAALDAKAATFGASFTGSTQVEELIVTDWADYGFFGVGGIRMNGTPINMNDGSGSFGGPLNMDDGDVQNAHSVAVRHTSIGDVVPGLEGITFAADSSNGGSRLMRFKRDGDPRFDFGYDAATDSFFVSNAVDAQLFSVSHGGVADASGFSAGGTPGFAGSGAFTNLTFVGGLCVDAS